MNIEQRVNLSTQMSRYVRARERYNEAVREFENSCEALRATLSPNSTAVVAVGGKYLMVSTDRACDFDIQEVEFVA